MTAQRPSEPSEPDAAGAYAARPWLAAYPHDVPADFDFPQVPLTRLLDAAAEAFPRTVAISYSGTAITYRQLVHAVDRLAGGLAALDVTAGTRVAVVLPNCPQHVIAFFAVLRLAATVVQCNPLATPDELRDQLTETGADVVVCLDRTFATVDAVREKAGVRHVVVTSLLDYYPATARRRLRLPLRKARTERARLVTPLPRDARVVPFHRLVRSPRPARQAPVDPATDVAVLQFTGGTTGTAKAAMLSHANLVANAYQVRLWLPEATSGREVTVAVLPLFHVYGLTLCLLTTVLLAGRLVLLPRFDLDLLFTAIESERPTLFPGVPPIYQTIVDSPRARRHDLASIRACISGAMRLPTDTQERFERITGGRLVEGYGMTESSPATHCNPVHGVRRPGSIGVPLPGTAARVVDESDPGRVMPVGERGELAVKGPQVFLGYWGRDPSEVLLDDGWLLTGDVAVMDPDGFFTIVDRKKDIIIAGGFNVFPAEVEAVVAAYDGVAECCVAGLPDRYRGETVKAYVVPKPGADLDPEDIRAHCAERLTPYKVPRLVELRDDLPRTAVGKALRRQLVADDLAGQDRP